MKDTKRFKKLFGVKVPCEEHFDYYISVLSKTHKFSNIYDIIKLYEEAEDKYDNFNDWSHKKSNEIIDYLKTTLAYKGLIETTIGHVSANKKPFKADIGKRYLSIDLKKANWQVLKFFDDMSQLPGTYEQLLNEFVCPEVLKYSKSYRQFIFGNLNPKSQQNVQASMMQALVMLFDKVKVDYKLEDFKHDEIIISNYEDSVFKYIDKLEFDFRVEEFIPTVVDNVKVYEYYEPGTDEVLYKKLFNSPGNRMYINLKKYILNEPIELRDLYFKDNNKLALWADDVELLKGLL